MIEMNHLTKKYGNHVAVDDLSLTVEPGLHLWLFRAEWGRKVNDNEYGHRIFRSNKW